MKRVLIAILAAGLLLSHSVQVLADETSLATETNMVTEEAGSTTDVLSTKGVEESITLNDSRPHEMEPGESLIDVETLESVPDASEPESEGGSSESLPMENEVPSEDMSVEETEPETEEATTTQEESEQETEESKTEPETEEAETEGEEKTESAHPDFEKKEDFVAYLISLIDDAFPDENIVRQARAEFDQLTIAQQVRLSSADKLFAAERLLNAADSTEPVDQEKTKSGTKYSFRLNKYLPRVSLYLWYITDVTGDGKPDAPVTTIVAPNGVAVSISDVMMEVNDDNCEVQIVRSSQYTKLDFLRALEGTWSVMTSHRVSFELRDYEQQASPFSEAESTAAPAPTGERPAPTKSKTNIIPLILFAVGVPLLFLFIKKMGKKTPQKENEESEKEKAKRQKQEREREMEQIRRDWFEMHEHEYSDEPKKRAAPEQKKETDVRLEQTQEELDDDSDIEDVDEEDLSFFSKPRF